MSAAVSLPGNSGGGSTSKAKVKCQFCDRLGHTTKQCFKLKKLLPWMFNNDASQTANKTQVNCVTQTGQSTDSKWIMDSGANQHVVQDL